MTTAPSFIAQAEAFASGLFQKVKSWVTKEVKVGEEALALEGHRILNGAVDLAIKVEPALLASLSVAWKNVVQRAEAGALDAPALEQAVIQEAEVLGEDVVAAAATMGSPELQALFAIFNALGLHL